jgi:leucine-zipper of insertion element IS481
VSAGHWCCSRPRLPRGVAGLVDRSRRPNSCPHRCSADVEVVVVEMRRKHPGWGAKRIRMQLLKAGGPQAAPGVVQALAA